MQLCSTPTQNGCRFFTVLTKKQAKWVCGHRGRRQNCKISRLVLRQQLHSSTVNVMAVDSFLYLGSEITSSGYSSNMGKLDRVWSNRQLSLSSKLRIYNCCILALLLYGSETCTILKADRQKLQSLHLRGVYWGSASDFVINADVSARTGRTDVHSIISQRRHALFGHIRDSLLTP